MQTQGWQKKWRPLLRFREGEITSFELEFYTGTYVDILFISKDTYLCTVCLESLETLNL